MRYDETQCVLQFSRADGREKTFHYSHLIAPKEYRQLMNNDNLLVENLLRGHLSYNSRKHVILANPQTADPYLIGRWVNAENTIGFLAQKLFLNKDFPIRFRITEKSEMVDATRDPVKRVRIAAESNDSDDEEVAPAQRRDFFISIDYVKPRREAFGDDECFNGTDLTHGFGYNSDGESSTHEPDAFGIGTNATNAFASAGQDDMDLDRDPDNHGDIDLDLDPGGQGDVGLSLDDNITLPRDNTSLQYVDNHHYAL